MDREKDFKQGGRGDKQKAPKALKVEKQTNRDMKPGIMNPRFTMPGLISRFVSFQGLYKIRLGIVEEGLGLAKVS
jgi:hypothetical protein